MIFGICNSIKPKSMNKIIIPVGTSRKIETLQRPEIKIHHHAEKVTVTVFNRSKTAKVELTITATGDTYIITVEDPPQTEFKLEPIPE